MTTTPTNSTALDFWLDYAEDDDAAEQFLAAEVAAKAAGLTFTLITKDPGTGEPWNVVRCDQSFGPYPFECSIDDTSADSIRAAAGLLALDMLDAGMIANV